MTPTDVALIDWSAWAPTERAVLCFVRRGGELLLIRKKRGLGAGKVNGPGGRIERGESAREAAVRETLEEVGVTPLGVSEAGELAFQFTDGYGLHCRVFVACGFDGELRETDEALPFWCAERSVPFDQMWADDRLWFPLMLAGKWFRGVFVFDGDTMLSQRIESEQEKDAHPGKGGAEVPGQDRATNATPGNFKL